MIPSWEFKYALFVREYDDNPLYSPSFYTIGKNSVSHLWFVNIRANNTF